MSQNIKINPNASSPNTVGSDGEQTIAVPHTNNPKFLVNNEVTEHASHMLAPEYMAAYQAGLFQAKMVDRAQRRARFFHMTQLFNLSRGVPGYTAEAGVFRGLGSYLICHYLRREIASFNGETHYMIDSFEGLSTPVEKDGEFPRKRHGEGAFTKTSVETVKETMKDFSATNILQGWIPEVFDEMPEQKYRFVHVDVDVYEPTLASFRYFYPRLAPGGIIVCDDFGPWEDNNWPGCMSAINEFANETGQIFAQLNTGNVFFIKR